MPRISLSSYNKSNDFNFTNRVVAEHLHMGGTICLVHKYLGIAGTENNDDLVIQDLLFMENRDRVYDKDVFELRAQYTIQDNDAFDLTQFAMFSTNDSLFMTFHENTMVDALGRRLMSGDVIEVPHLRDDLVAGSTKAINRFFVVQEGSRPAEGYDARWWSHLWRVRLSNITDSQEYRDLLGTGDEVDDLRNAISKYQKEIEVNDAIITEAQGDVRWDPRYMETNHYFFDATVPDKPVDDRGGDGAYPINGISLAGTGASFPTSGINDDEYYLRTDFIPNRLYQKSGNRWLYVGTDNRFNWTAANRKLTTFINNNDTTTNTDGSIEPVKTNLSKVIQPKADN